MYFLESRPLITCNLTKLESAVDQVRKTYPKLAAADAALIASAMSLAGRHAKAVYEGEYFVWPNDNEKLMISMSGHLRAVNEAIEENTPKKTSKTAVIEEEPVVVNVGLAPNMEAGEAILKNRDDLKTLLSDILQSGVEYVYGSQDLGWQWALDRANWNVISDGDLSRRIKIKVGFTEGAVGVEQGAATKKSRKKTEE